ncbi:MAG: hypothetical protein P1U34_01315 [Coxiellaceae bacterium]|nr:hypothetical protein [Coxiellaceae bacterium]
MSRPDEYYTLAASEAEAREALLPKATTRALPTTAPATRVTKDGIDYRALSGEDTDNTSLTQHVYVKTAIQIDLLMNKFKKASDKDKPQLAQQMLQLLSAAEAYGALLSTPSAEQQKALDRAKAQQAKAAFVIMAKTVNPRKDNSTLREMIHNFLHDHYKLGMTAADFRTQLTEKQYQTLQQEDIFIEVHVVIAALEVSKAEREAALRAKHVLSPRP